MGSRGKGRERAMTADGEPGESPREGPEAAPPGSEASAAEPRASNDPRLLKRWLIALGVALALVVGVLIGVLFRDGDSSGTVLSEALEREPEDPERGPEDPELGQGGVLGDDDVYDDAE